MNIIVLCAGGHARVVIEALRSRNITPAGITDIDAGLNGKLIAGIPCIGTDDVVDSMTPQTVQLANGCGNRAKLSDSGLASRRKLFERFTTKKYHFPKIVHASAIAASDTIIGDGAQLMAGSIVQAGASVGTNTIVNSGAIVEHDCKIGSHVHIAPGAILCGSVTIAEEVHVGAGAIVLQGLSIGRRAIIAAGMVITRDVLEGETIGIPFSKNPGEL
jgi:UDP-perosamine 4-acetyltransferase